ncbi:MAG: hypothetical protein COB54_01200 [Alphaproteobacteria bacterium]|nr:MAG: hypothetical protein COB54_01200 [Alphaproteobacteria bacterium]
MNTPLKTFFLLVVPAVLLSQAQAAELQLTPTQLSNITLTTSTVTHRENSHQLQLNGVLTADQRRTHRVASIVGGIVYDVQVVAHQKVRKGQVLARLRSPSLGKAQAEYLEALALFDLAQGDRKRIEGLWQEGVVSESRWRKVESSYKGAQAILEARRRMLSIAGLTAGQITQLPAQPDKLAAIDLISPVDGTVTGVDIEAGQLLEIGQAAFHIDDLSVVWAMVKIPVASLSQVVPGVDAVIHSQANASKTYGGNLSSLGAEVDLQSQTVAGRIILENPTGELRPGMYVEVSLDTVARQGLMAPASAVFRVGNQAYLFRIMGEGRYMPQAIMIGAEANGWVPIHSGIDSGVRIVTTGVAELKSHWQYQGGE